MCRAIAVMVAAGFAAHAHAGMINLGAAGGRVPGSTGGAGGGGIPNLGISPQQALQASQPSIRNLANAAQGIAQQIAAQQAAAAAAAANAANVPNGLAPGGLQVGQGVTFNADGTPTATTSNLNNPNLWINANAPKQGVDSSGHVTVEVDQTSQNAVATWTTMNVGKQTTLYFNQSAGTQSNGANNWVILNRIMDPTGLPSQILGNVKAEGSVFVVNRNGILFGAGSQVNVHSLLASSLDLLNTTDTPTQGASDIVSSNKLFLNMQPGTQGGLAALESVVQGSSAQTGAPNEVLGLGNQVKVNSPTDYVLPGNITIEQGASITTQTQGTVSDGGFVMVAAPNVTNGGSITATGGQVILAAGVGVALRPNPLAPQQFLPEISGQLVIPTGPTSVIDITPAGSLVNTGIIQATRGTVDLLGSSVAQNGVVGVTTSVNTPGNITISTVDENPANTPSGTAYPGQLLVTNNQGGGADATNRAGLLTFGPGSVTTIMPDTDGETATSAPGTTFTPGSITMTAGSVWFQSGSLIEAPGSTVSVAALTPSSALDATPPGDTAVQGRILLDTGATIDVSGLSNVELSVAQSLVTVPLIGGNELADSPLLRDGFLFGLKNVVVDSTLSGTRSDGVPWVGSPLLNLAGLVSLIPRTVDQLLVNGGTVTLAGNEVMTAAGSSLNLNGGYVHFLGGMVNPTRLIDSSGAIVPIGDASPNDTYVGIAGQFVDNHPRWGISNSYFDPLLSGGTFEGDFIVGGNAGTLNIFASSAMVLDGDITAQALSGSKQVQDNNQAVGGTFNLGADPSSKVPGNLAALTQGSTTSTTGESGTVILQNSAPQLDNLAANFSIDTPIDTAAQNALSASDPNNVLANTVVPTSTLSDGGFANVNVTEDKIQGTGFVVPAGTQLNLQPGGSLTLNAPNVANAQIDGHLVVPSGTISILLSEDSTLTATPTEGNIVVGPDALLSTAGQWVNNDTQFAAGTTTGDSEFINGGSVTLAAGYGVDLQPGSLIDVSSGGEVQANGQMLMNNGIAQGKGGGVTLQTLLDQAGYPAVLPTDPLLHMDGTIRSFGFSGGGTLTLEVLGIQIGGDPAAAPSYTTVLPTDFFAQQGFGNYVLNAYLDATVAPGATVDVTQQNLLPNVQALQQTASGANLSGGGLTTVGTTDAFDRQSTDLVLTAGGYAAWHVTNSSTGTAPPVVPDYPGVTGAVTIGEGASVVADAGASIGLGSPAQVTVLGSLIAPGGSIALIADSGGGSSFELTGQYNGTGGVFTGPGKSVWLGPDSLLDVAGVALTDPFAAPVQNGLSTIIPVTGKVLAGGSVTISDDSGYIVAQAGSRIDVSGASANFDQFQANRQFVSQPVWSDAGSVTLVASSGLLFDGTLDAHGGAPQAQGGTLLIMFDPAVSGTPFGVGGNQPSLPGATALIIEQSGEFVPAGLQPGDSFASAIGTPPGVLQFAADRLDGSGVSTLVLGAPANTPLATQGTVPIAFSGNVNLNLAQAVVINAQTVAALGSDAIAQLSSTTTLASLLANEANGFATNGVTQTGTDVSITAPYVAFVGPTFRGSFITPVSPIFAVGDGKLSVNASFIDLENQFQLNNFGQANFTSSGDIRLSSSNALSPGLLFTSGNLTFKAADLYPSTGSTFILDAVGPTTDANGDRAPTTITFEANGASDVPLSAGGTLLVDATDIVQGGTVRAPAGSLIFGVGDSNDAATQAQFNWGTSAPPPLVSTNSVTFASGSLTSVSEGGAIIPFGTTVDGVEWQFNPVPNANAAPDVTAPPSKFVGANGSNVALNAGATIDLSGGGDLQAAEFVAGTGGTRNVLQQFSVSFASNPGGTAIPVNANGSNVYAILPGKQSPVAAYDPMFAQNLQPSTNANGSAGTTTKSDGVGQAGLNNAVGQSVYLSGVPGLPAGFYTLLPGMYATLPGAFRVTVSSATGPVAPGASQTLPDGTVQVGGYFGNSLSGTRSGTPTLFDVQSGKVWQQYSQFTFTSANAFFPNLAANAGNVAPQLPVDAGQLVLSAKTGLSLGAKLDTAAGPGGAPAEVDIASQDIQIVGNGEAALPGYLQISADQLDALDAGSLLIGGTRKQTNSGFTIDAISNSVVVSNDASNPLTGPEILLVTKTDPSGADVNAKNGLRIDAGSVIEAQGTFPAAKDLPITIGVAPGSDGSGGISGDGALLRVSNGADATVTRLDTTDASTNPGLLTVGAGATLTGGQSLTLDSSGNLKFDPTATFSGNTIAVDGSAITFTDQTGDAAAALPGFVIGAAQLAQLSNAQMLILRSSGAMNFDGNVDVTFGPNVDLSAGLFVSDGGATTLNGKQIEFTNELGGPATNGAAGSGTLTVNANEIDFGAGDKTTSGFGSAVFNATGGIVGQNTGTFDFGATPVTMNAPVYMADTSSSQTIKTTGVLTLNAASGTALPLAPVGGEISFTGGTLNDNGATIEAPAGNVSLEATTGDLTISAGSLVSSAGVAKQFFDITAFAPAGSITLTADEGSVNVQSGATLDFSGASQGGAAGSVSLSAPEQVVNLNGTLKGNAAAGFMGGSFSLDTGGAVDLDSLATTLATSGVNNAISVETHTGNLTLSSGNTLTAHRVSLTADGGAGGENSDEGKVIIGGTINASGLAGGEIDLFGKSGVDVEGSLIAIACLPGGPCDDTHFNPNQRGGTVNIGTTGNGSTTSLNSTYGYENVTPDQSGVITLGGNSLIDVTGGTAGGLSGGTVNFRAPITTDGTVNVTVTPGATITGSRATTLEAYAVWSTDDQSTNAAQHFDGIVDPAGWFGDTVAGAGQPGMVAGTWTDQNGNPLPAPTPDQLADYLKNDFFTPTQANTDHQTFYGYVNNDGTTPGTLMSFVQKGVDGVAAQFANTGITVAPGIELDNPDANINNGNISILTNWNLGAGSSPTNQAFRFLLNGAAPIITFRAENNVEVKASLSDGFFQISNPVTPGAVFDLYVPPFSDQGTANTLYSSTASSYGFDLAYYGYNSGSAFPYGNITHAPASFSGQPTDDIKAYFALYEAYADFLLAPASGGTWQGIPNVAAIWQSRKGLPASGLAAPTAPDSLTQMNDPVLYLLYLQQYESYLVASTPVGAPTTVLPPQAPIGEGVNPASFSNIGQTVSVTAAPTVDNTPSPVGNAINPLPMQSASLSGGPSSSFRIVAGANIDSANPLAVQAASMFSANGQGNVTLSGQFDYVDANGRMIIAPTMIRTGTGSIEVAAGNDVSLFDASQQTNDSTDIVVPGVIYTAGAPAAGSPAVGETASILKGGVNQPDLLVTPAVNPDSAGDISIFAQGDINGLQNVVDTSGAVTGTAGQNISQFWTQWMQSGNVTASGSNAIVQTSINFGSFDQGVLSAGGNVNVSAGGNISDLAVSLPTTWYRTSTDLSAPVTTVGGGNLTVTAGGNLFSGDYFVANGTGTISAGGQIGADLTVPSTLLGKGPFPVAPIFAEQNGVLNISARQGVNIGAVVDPSYLPGGDDQAYSASSALNVVSTTGDIQFGTLDQSAASGLNMSSPSSNVLPATVDLTAFTGGIAVQSAGWLFPSATGNLNLIADQSISLSDVASASRQGESPVFGMLDVDPSAMPSPTNPDAPVPLPVDINAAAHSQTPLHADDTVPARVYSLNGSIVDGVMRAAGQEDAGFFEGLVALATDKPVFIEAGLDITNLSFRGQNLREDDVTRIIAGRDIADTPLPTNGGGAIPGLVLGGPGAFDVEAGRNIGPLTNEQQVTDSAAPGINKVPTVLGIETVGNADNPNLPHESATIQVLFGISPGVDYSDFIAAYVNPFTSVLGFQNSGAALIEFMTLYDAGQRVDTGLVKDEVAALNSVGPMTVAQAWTQFEALPSFAQHIFARNVFSNVLTEVGNDFNNPASPFHGQFARGYQAINTLFPASLGYTANNLDGGTNGANTLVQTGNLDIRSTTIQTQQGGDVSIFGPGGQALVGSTSAPPEIVNGTGQVVAGPGTMGILTLEQGDINIFTDQSVLLAQSRIFTEQGGNMTIWSSNGDINAGKGSKSSADVPAPIFACDPNHFCTVDARGEVTGAGIATLQTIPGAAPGDVNLIAPRGTVDAGDAGIRVSGTLNVAALHVANANNIQAQKQTGIQTAPTVDTGALTAASSASSAASQMAQEIAKRNSAGVPHRHWIISVQVEGFGDSGDDDDKKKRRGQQVGYDSSSAVSIVGFGSVGATQRAVLSKGEQEKLGKI
nr:filamentous haemagglutinin family protein [Paraburkholderia edwinii]